MRKFTFLALVLMSSAMAEAQDDLVGETAWDPATSENVRICKVDADGTLQVAWSCRGFPRLLPRQRSEIVLALPELDGVKAKESYVLWFGGKPTAHWVLSKAWNVYEDYSVMVADRDDSPVLPRPTENWKVPMKELRTEVPSYEAYTKGGVACVAQYIEQDMWKGKRMRIDALFPNGMAALTDDTWVTRHVREAQPTRLFELRDFEPCTPN